MLFFILLAFSNAALGAVAGRPVASEATVMTEATGTATRAASTPAEASGSITSASALSSATPIPSPVHETTRDALAQRNWAYFNDLTSKAWSEDFYTDHIITYANGTKEDVDTNELSKRQGTTEVQTVPFSNWYAMGFNANTWGYLLTWTELTDRSNSTHNYEAGGIIKTVTSGDETTQLVNNKWWWNGTYKITPKSSGQPTGVGSLYNGWATQCIDRLWNPAVPQWEPRGWNSNNDLYWTYNNASYDYHQVRTIYDCLLDRVAVEYKTYVSDLGARPVRYILEGMKYYRFYDGNGYAWFAACPTAAQWNSKKGKAKRQGARGRNSNPIWDFSVLAQRYWNSDMTPFPTANITGYNYRKVYTGMYFPSEDARIREVEGDTCQFMALTRPGLRHWTARLFDIPAETYPDIKKEINFGYGWWGYKWWSQSYTTAAFEWAIPI